LADSSMPEVEVRGALEGLAPEIRDFERKLAF